MIRAYALRAGALVVGWILAAAFVLGCIVAACSAVAEIGANLPERTPRPTEDVGDIWGAPIYEPTRAPRASWPVVLPSDGMPAGDLYALCDQLEAPGAVPECVELGY